MNELLLNRGVDGENLAKTDCLFPVSAHIYTSLAGSQSSNRPQLVLEDISQDSGTGVLIITLK